MKINPIGHLVKTNPIQTQFPKRQNECKLTYNKGLQKKRCFRSQKKQTQFKPNFRKAKMNANVFLTKDYENETALRPQKNKPNQSQFRNPTAGRQNVLHNKVHTAFIVRKAKVVQKTVVLVERPMAIGYKIAKGKSKKQETRNTRYDKGDKI